MSDVLCTIMETSQDWNKYKDVFSKDGKCKTIGRRLISSIIPFSN